MLHPELIGVNNSIWVRIFKLPFKIVGDKMKQACQYRVLHYIIPCNERHFNIKIKDSNICNFYDQIDTLPHFFVPCQKVNYFWKYWFNLWEKVHSDGIPR